MMFKRTLIKLFRNMSSDTSSIIIEKHGSITTIGINRPERRNCINLTTAKLLENAIKIFEEDESSAAAVLYGTGGNFCSGLDLNEIASLDENSNVHEVIENMSLSHKLKNIRKPVVAALSGYTVGSGLELALLCDLRVMEDTAILGLFGRRFGIPLIDGGTVRLPLIIGLSRTMDIVLTGRPVYAKEAFEWGLANRIVACGTSLGQSIQLANSLVKFPQTCLCRERETTYNSVFNKIYEEYLLQERENIKKIKSKDIIDGARKFINGLGRHGKTYNLRDQEICQWEKEFNQNPKSKL